MAKFCLLHVLLLKQGLATPGQRHTPPVRRTWLACHLAGGTHHAFPNHGSGFCIVNDCAVAARVLLEEGRMESLMVIDLDVHQGDAKAAIFAAEPRVFTFSAHCANNFPRRKQNIDVDLPLADDLEDGDYLIAIGDLIPDLLLQHHPQLVLYNADVDEPTAMIGWDVSA